MSSSLNVTFLLPNSIKDLSQESLMLDICVNPAKINWTLKDAAPRWSSKLPSTGGSVAPCLDWNWLCLLLSFCLLFFSLFLSLRLMFLLILFLSLYKYCCLSQSLSYFRASLSPFVPNIHVAVYAWERKERCRFTFFFYITHSSLPGISEGLINPEEWIAVIKRGVITSQMNGSDLSSAGCLPLCFANKLAF